MLSVCRWDTDFMVSEFYEDSERLLKKARTMLETPSDAAPAKGATEECPICTETQKSSSMINLECGNRICKSCTSSYVDAFLQHSEPPVKCPFRECTHVLGSSKLKAACTSEAFERYQRICTNKHIQSDRMLRQCSNCGAIAKATSLESPVTVKCTCGYSYCWNCGSASHVPIPCKQIRIWTEKGSDPDGKLSQLWVKANTKKCPRCNNEIQKNQGCNHMKCRCGYEFCWLCRGPWSEHGQSTGGFYSCNRYKASNAKDLDTQAQKEQDRLARYSHFYERFFNYQKDLTAGEEQLANAKRKTEEYTKECTDNPSSPRFGMNPQFIYDGVELELQCRKLLMYSYVIAYFMPGKDSGPEAGTRKELFELHQANLEGITERLAELNQKPLLELDDNELRSNIRWTREYLTNMEKMMYEAAESIRTIDSEN